jgi:CRP-like cAMP-binding protein
MKQILNTFLEQVKAISPIPNEELEKLKLISKVTHIKKGDYFLRQGDNSSHIAFVVNGLFRISYLTEDGKEFTKGFLPENDFLVAYSALIEKRESYFSIEALENSTIVVIDYFKWKELFKEEISWNKFLIVILEQAFCKKERREREFLLFDAKTRYESFLNTYPKLSHRIKQHILASYLGISPVTLSNLRKEKN